MGWQSFATAAIVAACSGYALWALAPAALWALAPAALWALAPAALWALAPAALRTRLRPWLGPTAAAPVAACGRCGGCGGGKALMTTNPAASPAQAAAPQPMVFVRRRRGA